jgi:hypothetical protein
MSKFLLTLIGGLLAAQIGIPAPAFAEPSVDGEVTKVDESAGRSPSSMARSPSSTWSR